MSSAASRCGRTTSKLRVGGRLILFLAASAWGCGDEVGRSSQPPVFNAPVVTEIPSSDAAAPFVNIADLLVDSSGSVWVLDQGAKELRRFDASGALIGVVARGGRGPGEVANPIGLSIDSEGSVWVVDAGAARYSVFDSAGRYVRSVPRQVTGFSIPWRGGWLRDGRFVDVRSTRLADGRLATQLLLYVNAGDRLQLMDSTIVEPLGAPAPVFEASGPAGAMRAAVPFSPEHHWTLGATGGVLAGHSANGILHRYGLDFALLGVDTLRAPPRPVSPALRDSALAGLQWLTEAGAKLDAARVPTRRPLYDALLASTDGRGWAKVDDLWLPVLRTESDAADAAALRAQLNVFPAPRAGAGWLAGVMRDALGVPTVRVYRVP